MNIASVNIKTSILSINYSPTSMETTVIENANVVVDDPSLDKLILLHSYKCYYCINFLPIWNQAKDKYGDKFQFEMIDCEKTPELAKNYNHEGLPTIVKQTVDGKTDSTMGYQVYDQLEHFIKKDITVITNNLSFSSNCI